MTKSPLHIQPDTVETLWTDPLVVVAVAVGLEVRYREVRRGFDRLTRQGAVQDECRPARLARTADVFWFRWLLCARIRLGARHTVTHLWYLHFILSVSIIIY